MEKFKVIVSALAASLAAGAFCFGSTAADVATAPEPATVAEPAPAGPATATPYSPPRYFNPYKPRRDNPTNPPGTWEVYPSPTTNDLYCVDFVDANNGWAGGRSVALRYRNGTWSVIPGHSGHVFEDIDMLSTSDGWAVGWDGNKELPAIWRWNGSDWVEFQNPMGAVSCIDMIDAGHGWIGGNRYFLRYNGTMWEWGGGAPDIMTAIQMFSDTDGRAVGYNYIMKREGNNWIQEVYNANWAVADLYMINRNQGWGAGRTASSSGGLIIVYDGTWKQCKIFTEARTITELDIVGGTLGWCCGWKNATPPYGAFLGYYDGNDWYVLTAPTDKGLLGVDMIDLNNGWVVGIGGVILKYRPNVGVIPTSVGRIKAIYH
jgi:hypothetical protein